MPLNTLCHPLNSPMFADYKKSLDGWHNFSYQDVTVNYVRVPIVGNIGFINLWPVVDHSETLPLISDNLNNILVEKRCDIVLMRPLLMIEENRFYDEIINKIPAPFAMRPLVKNILGYATYVLDLSQGLEAVMQSFNATTRKQIRQVEKAAGLEIAVNDKIDLSRFYEKYSANLTALGAPVLSFERVNYLLKAFAGHLYAVLLTNTKNETEYYHLFLIYGNIGLSFLASNDRATDSDKVSRNLPKYTLYLGLKYLADHGIKYFDHGGVNLTNPQLAGIDNFKRGFGGRLCKSSCYVIYPKKSLAGLLVNTHLIDLALLLKLRMI